jgi:hypothetical protein
MVSSGVIFGTKVRDQVSRRAFSADCVMRYHLLSIITLNRSVRFSSPLCGVVVQYNYCLASEFEWSNCTGLRISHEACALG